ncbi:uncharacterized protein LOC133844094 [Drosophila sulfurigaster albostrigata]|uniref:uncharacterized protein LOC133844094 n=1 Tax=Drosophila sulfurigaster albostrigata TaxID=89887 RepID=UPI002D21EBC0|nr:uncharacterized protein LOC133844094 [Drosophila sulfurigaster albostrigata]
MTDAEQEVQHQESESKLIAFRCALLVLFFVCFASNLYNCVYHVQVIAHYSTCPACEFTSYESLVLTVAILMQFMLVIGVYLVLTQKIRELRVFIMLFFLAGWLQMLLILVLTQRYPIAHDVHFRWQEHRSLAHFEDGFGCCGVLGPDDYLLTTGQLPSSCFDNHSNLTKDLHYKGCLNKENGSSAILRYEFLTSLFQLILLVFLIMFYLHLKKIKAPKRNLHSVWKSRIIL